MNATPGQGRLRQVLTGKVQALGVSGTRSAIAKQVVDAPVEIGFDGIVGDEQADRRVHGGFAKAVLCYSWSHYLTWQRELPVSPLLQQPGAFGENFSVDGLDERTVCIGDQWSVGTARFEVSQGRQPCWKLNQRFGLADMSTRVHDSLRPGWYLRVLQPGHLAGGNGIVRIANPYPHWPLHRLLEVIRDRHCGRELLAEVLTLPLTPSWRKLMQGRLSTGRVESWASRLTGIS